MAAGSAGKKFQAPALLAHVDAGKVMKLAQRVEHTLMTEALFPDPKQIDPNLILVSPRNRLGASPNVQHVHFGILKSFLKSSFDRYRLAVDICVEYMSEKGIHQFLDHNRRFSHGNKFLPTILPSVTSGPVYASLACTHLNLALRCIKQGSQSPIGDLSAMISGPDNKSLKEVALDGHKWWVLPEHVGSDKQIDISLWRNQDQNENQATNEIEIMRTITHSAKKLLEGGQGKVSLGDLVSAAQRKNPAKISSTTWMSLTKYYIGFLENGAGDLVEDLSEFHSACVDPRELTVSLRLFQLLAGEDAFRSCPYFRHYMVTTQYTTEKMQSCSYGPSVSQCLEHSHIIMFAKKPADVKALERTIQGLREKYLPILAKGLGDRVARLEMTI